MHYSHLEILRSTKYIDLQMRIFSFRYAEDIVIGDGVLVKRNNEFIDNKVIHVSSFTMQGEKSS